MSNRAFGPNPLPSVMTAQQHFSQIPSVQLQRSVFDRTHAFKTTLNSAALVPFYVDEVLPGDTFNLSATFFARLSTPLKPFMDNLHFETFFFFVPNRLLWTNWEKFNGAQDNPGDSITFLVPQVHASLGGSVEIGTLWDYMGLPAEPASPPPGWAPPVDISALPFRAYNLIYNEWFRDENLQNSVPNNTGNGPDSLADYVLRNRGRRKDYFTGALPWPQKGNAVTLPLGSTAPVISDGTVPKYHVSSGTNFTDGSMYFSTATTNHFQPMTVGSAVSGTVIYDTTHSGLQTDLSSATAATINAIRQAFQIQRLLERDARGGTRYTEILRAHFGVVSPDARLQRPEYLGGGHSMVAVNPIAQTSASPVTPSETATPQANLAAVGTLGAVRHGFVKSFVEHGVLLGLMSIRADQTFQEQVNRMWTRSTRYDFYWPALSHLGEQAIQNRELTYQGGSGNTDSSTFGYQERYAEYRYKPSVITGLFRSNQTASLDFWHLAMDYGGACPALGDVFIQESPPVSRVVAIDTEPQFLLDSHIALRTARPMPVYSVPGLVDHF